MPPPAQALPDPPAGRFHIAFDDGTLVWAPTWTCIDAHPNLVTSYTIDRGRQYELDRTDTGRAVVEIKDPTGLLDPTNTSGPYHGKIEPLRQAMLCRRNPVTGEWKTRFRGFIEEFDYAYHPSQKVTMLTVQLVDIFEILAAIEMQPAVKTPTGNKPATFGDTPPKEIAAQDVVWFAGRVEVGAVRDRLEQAVNTDAGIPAEFCVFFSGNVNLWPATYSPGENVMSVVQDCADAEFPGAANVYADRYGRLVFHGRLARFTPLEVWDSITLPGRWNWQQWYVGDGVAVATDPANTAQMREFAYERGLAKVINSCSATPQWSPRSTITYTNGKATGGVLKELTTAEINGQLYTDDTSIGQRGIRSQSFQNLQTEGGQLDPDTNALQETKRFAQYYVSNYAVPHNRVTAIGFRSISTTNPGAAVTWRLLSELDISDLVTIDIGAPGGGGFVSEQFYVEGVHEECRALNPLMDDVTLHLDLSPKALYTIDPWQ
jgi:hypothetical protein